MVAGKPELLSVKVRGDGAEDQAQIGCGRDMIGLAKQKGATPLASRRVEQGLAHAG
jgi:hypothetical protein